MDTTKLEAARNYALTRNGSGMVARFGYKVDEWGSQTLPVPVFSVTKGIGALLLGRAVDAGQISLSERAINYYSGFGLPPQFNANRPVGDVTIEQLATHSAGFQKEVWNDSEMTGRQRQDPGKYFIYSDAGANWLAETLTVVRGTDLFEVLKSEILAPLQITPGPELQDGDLNWRVPSQRPTIANGLRRREFNAGITANVDAMARIGVLLARNGVWEGGQRILSEDFINRLKTPSAIIAGLPVVDALARPDDRYPNATAHHGLFWWNNADGAIPDVPTDTFWTWGLGDHLIVVVPSLDLVAARVSSDDPHDGSNENPGRYAPNPWGSDDEDCAQTMCARYDVLTGFIGPLVAAVNADAPPPAAPTVTLASSASSATTGTAVTLTWSSTNATACTASNGWTGSKATSGTESVTVNANATYVLECTGPGGTASQSVAVTATAAPAPTPTPTPTPPPADDGGGGGALQWWMLLGLLGASSTALRNRRRRV